MPMAKKYIKCFLLHLSSSSILHICNFEYFKSIQDYRLLFYDEKAKKTKEFFICHADLDTFLSFFSWLIFLINKQRNLIFLFGCKKLKNK